MHWIYKRHPCNDSGDFAALEEGSVTRYCLPMYNSELFKTVWNKIGQMCGYITCAKSYLSECPRGGNDGKPRRVVLFRERFVPKGRPRRKLEKEGEDEGEGEGEDEDEDEDEDEEGFHAGEI
ncbi:hypothetical protein M0804_002784 [Polistes exclamans]|nr:hypothetical protein M0804_002784 [Polistes exclamans]